MKCRQFDLEQVAVVSPRVKGLKIDLANAKLEIVHDFEVDNIIVQSTRGLELLTVQPANESELFQMSQKIRPDLVKVFTDQDSEGHGKADQFQRNKPDVRHVPDMLVVRITIPHNYEGELEVIAHRNSEVEIDSWSGDRFVFDNYCRNPSYIGRLQTVCTRIANNEMGSTQINCIEGYDLELSVNGKGNLILLGSVNAIQGLRLKTACRGSATLKDIRVGGAGGCTLEVKGEGSIVAQNAVVSHHLNVIMEGKGNVTLQNVSADQLNGKLSGSGQLQTGVVKLRRDCQLANTGEGRVMIRHVASCQTFTVIQAGYGQTTVCGTLSCRELVKVVQTRYGSFQSGPMKGKEVELSCKGYGDLRSGPIETTRCRLVLDGLGYAVIKSVCASLFETSITEGTLCLEDGFNPAT